MLLVKPLIQFLMLLWFLCVKIPAPDVFIVQNSPSVPTLVAVKWASWLRFEKHYGKMANGSLCVTKAMQHELAQNWGIKTPDEDFGILLEAAVMYDRRVAALLNEVDSTGEEILSNEVFDGNEFLYPRLLFIITGKGPEKEQYGEKIRKLRLKRVAFRTMWLSAEDYPLLLGSADLGVCLHTSSSGLDLPMKVVDMFGCGLPVCAVSYSCIEELVKVEKNGLLFSSSSELADELLMLLKGFPDECNALNSLRNGALEMGSSARWATEWEENAKPLISEASPQF
ncbi:UDP-Glycosyltransferase superfamily protein [Actinidia rufa]|uniref:UDP-Glycosyltransferase superfamily protein n=1 Tax=Actinidia rufa TaxID=165716 RepID=A0A7J0GN96_9ERIC|nr:UDP-Glycosyltransferase superfamily protein [Actinidia rufa]